METVTRRNGLRYMLKVNIAKRKGEREEPMNRSAAGGRERRVSRTMNHNTVAKTDVFSKIVCRLLTRACSYGRVL